jgi:hypothetical protein
MVETLKSVDQQLVIEETKQDSNGSEIIAIVGVAYNRVAANKGIKPGSEQHEEALKSFVDLLATDPKALEAFQLLQASKK